jgi:ABC-2 type transport system ATP-binding protein
VSATVSATPTTLVSLQGVGVRFGQKQALHGVDLDVEHGGFVAVIGADGAGKSTLLRVLAGLRRPSEGKVARTLPKAEVGFSGSEFDLYGDLTVLENLRFFASVRGMRKAEFRQASDRILDMVGLTEAAERLAAALSGGMKKKLGLAAALIYEPALLLLDEPTVGVDPTSRRELWGIVAQAHATGTTVVFATTYLDEAERARQVVLLANGEATELAPESMESLAEGWQAWVLPEETRRNDLRVALARAGLDARVYLRQEGLTILARDLEEADELAGRVLACLPGEPKALPGPGLLSSRLEPASLALDDLFVLVQMGLADHKEGRA